MNWVENQDHNRRIIIIKVASCWHTLTEARKRRNELIQSKADAEAVRQSIIDVQDTKNRFDRICNVLARSTKMCKALNLLSQSDLENKGG